MTEHANHPTIPTPCANEQGVILVAGGGDGKVVVTCGGLRGGFHGGIGRGYKCRTVGSDDEGRVIRDLGQSGGGEE